MLSSLATYDALSLVNHKARVLEVSTKKKEEGGCGIQPGSLAGMEQLPDRICQDGLSNSK